MPIEATMRKATTGTSTAALAAAALASAAPVIDVQATVTDSNPTAFKDAILGTPAASSPATETANAVVRVEKQPVSVYEAASHGGFQGEWGQEDMKFPVLKIVQGSGPMSQKFASGSVVLGDEVLLAPPPMPPKPGDAFPILNFVPVSLSKRYRENLSNDAYKEGQSPRYVNTLAEVEALGGTTAWVGREKPSWGATATCFLLIEKPEGSVHPAFGLEMNGKAYAPAIFYASGSAYTDFAKTILSAQLSLQVPVGKDASGAVLKDVMVFKRVWSWETKKVLKGQNWIFCPAIRLTAVDTTEEVREICRNIKGRAAEEETTE